jgi:hypothetical protein
MRICSFLYFVWLVGFCPTWRGEWNNEQIRRESLPTRHFGPIEVTKRLRRSDS